MMLTREKSSTQRITYPSATLSTTNPTLSALGSKLDFSSKNPAANHVIYGKVTNYTSLTMLVDCVCT